MKPFIFLSAKANYWTFWEVFLFQSHLTANLLLLAILKKFKNSSEKPIYFSFKENLILERLRSLTKHYSENLLPVAFFQNFSFLFENPICSLWKKDPNFPLFWETLPIQSRSTANLLLLAILKTLQIFSRKTQLFVKSPNFERFRKS